MQHRREAAGAEHTESDDEEQVLLPAPSPFEAHSSQNGTRTESHNEQGDSRDGTGGGTGGGGKWWHHPASAFWNHGVAVAIGSSLCFATAAALVKSPLIQGRIPVFEIVVVRATISFLVTSLSCRANGLPLLGRTAPQLLLVARGVIGATAMTASYEALVRLPLADSTVIFYCSPALTALLAWLLLGERFTWLMAAGCSASLAGVALVAQPPWLVPGGAAAEVGGPQRLVGTVFGVAGATLAAGAYICIRLIGKREHPLTVAVYFHVAAFVSSAVPLSAGYPEPAVMPSPAQAALLLGIACGSFGGNLLVNRAFQLELAAKASAANFTQVIFAYLLGTVFFKDPLTLLGLAGTLLIAAGVAVVQLEKLLGTASKLAEGGVARDVPPANGGGDAGQAPATAGRRAGPLPGEGNGRWWQRLRDPLETGLKAKRSDLEAEMGQLPQHVQQQQQQFQYWQLGSGSGKGDSQRQAG